MKTAESKSSTTRTEKQEKEPKEISEKKQKAVDAWADAFSKRNGNTLYKLTADKEKLTSWNYMTAINDGKEYGFAKTCC